MATKTPNYELNKPAQEDFYDVDVFNDNMDKIDTALSNKVDKVAGKDLSENDYTTTDKNKVGNLPDNTKEELGKKANTTALNAKIDKVAAPTAGNIPKLKSDGSLEDSGKSLDDFAGKEHEEASVVSENGVHDIRYFKKKLEVFVDGEWKHAASGVGVEAHITAPAGAVVTATDGTTVVSDTATDGTLKMPLPNYGKWIISATLNGKSTNTVILECDDSKIYTVFLSFFSATIEVTAMEGSLVTLKKGDVVQTATSTGTVSFTILEAGTYSIYATYEGVNTNTVSVAATTSGATEMVSVNFITLDVTCDVGSRVVVTKGNHYYSGTSNGTTRFYLPETGEWNITASLSNSTRTESINISSYTNYAIEIIYYKVFGVVIDSKNSNPETAVTYTDDAVGMTGGSRDWDSMPIFKDIKPCLLKNGVVQKYLDPYDFTKDIDGNEVDIKSGNEGDVMIEIPKIGFKLVNMGTSVTVQITNDPLKEFDGFRYYAHTRQTEGDCEKLYVGAYLGVVTDSKLRSLSGSSPSYGASRNIGDFRTDAQANGEGYDLLSYYPLSLLQCLYLIRYKNLNSQAALGMGAVGRGGLIPLQTGATDQKSMYYGTNDDETQIKFAGIEDFYGNAQYFIDGIFLTGGLELCTAFEGFNDGLEGYQNHGRVFPSNSSNNYYIGTIKGTTELPFFTAGGGASATTYYCDTVTYLANSPFAFGGSGTSGADAGAFYIMLNGDFGNYVCGRLMYLKASN